MTRHERGCSFMHRSWGTVYCRCFVNQYLAAHQLKDSQGTANKVFDIPELRDMILSFLPMETLIQVERVNTAWQSSLERTLALQKTLFLKPTGAPLHHDMSRARRLEDSMEDIPYYPVYGVDLATNPRLLDEPRLDYGDAGQVSAVRLRLPLELLGFGPQPGDPAEYLKIFDRFRTKKWLKQYITQPPIKAIKFFCRNKTLTVQQRLRNLIARETESQDGWIYNAQGVTIDDVFAVMRSLVVNQGYDTNIIRNTSLNFLVVWPHLEGLEIKRRAWWIGSTVRCVSPNKGSDEATLNEEYALAKREAGNLEYAKLEIDEKEMDLHDGNWAFEDGSAHCERSVEGM